MEPTQEIYLFFGYWQIIVCLFAFAALMGIWHHFTTHRPDSTQDKGLVWLAMSVLVWVFSGILEVLFSTGILELEKESILIHGSRSTLSILNSTFILLSLPYFKHKPNQESINRLLEPRPWTFWVSVITVLFILLTLLFTIFLTYIPTEQWYGEEPALLRTINVIDVIYAFLTLAMLSLVLWYSFEARNLRILAWLTIVCILFTIGGQAFKMLANDFWGVFFACTFKTMLIMIFFALALSWVAEALEEEYLPELGAIKIAFPGQLNGKKHLIKLHLPPNLENQSIWFNPAPYLMIFKFAERRRSEAPNEGWLKMKPKGVNTRHDIGSYNQMKSIFKEVLNHQHGKGNWSNHELNFIRMALIEKHPHKDGYYRLRVQKQDIVINEY